MAAPAAFASPWRAALRGAEVDGGQRVSVALSRRALLAVGLGRSSFYCKKKAERCFRYFFELAVNRRALCSDHVAVTANCMLWRDHCTCACGSPTCGEVRGLRRRRPRVVDAEAAERLLVGVPTVKAHVRSICRKLGIGSRSAAARFAAENGLPNSGRFSASSHCAHRRVTHAPRRALLVSRTDCSPSAISREGTMRALLVVVALVVFMSSGAAVAADPVEVQATLETGALLRRRRR